MGTVNNHSFTPPGREFFFPCLFWEGNNRTEEREKEMEGTGDGSVEPQDPREWSAEKVTSHRREKKEMFSAFLQKK